jgi:hypothetical protein
MRAWSLVPLLLLAACGNTSGADVLRALIWPMPLPESVFGSPDIPEGRWDAEEGEAQAGETALALSLGSRRGIARLMQEEGERRLWRTAGGVVIATEGPRVVATAGLREILASTRFEGEDPLQRPAEIGSEGVSYERVVDLMRSGSDPAKMRFGLRLQCRLRPRATEQPDILLIEERCQGAARFTNRFWADASTRTVFRSEQWVGEDLPLLVIEVVGPPAEITALPR